MKVLLPDQSERELPDGATAIDLARAISEGLARHAVAAKVNGILRDLTRPLTQGDTVEIVKFDSPEGKEVFWHTSAHIMAQAVKALYPDVKIAIGPSIDNGFYYDFDTQTRFSPEDFEKIEAKMREIVARKAPIIRRELSKEEAVRLFDGQGEKYKVELIRELPDSDVLSVYTQEDFTDLCRGPHLPHTGMVKSVKILSVAGAYWRGSEKNPMLQRLYAISYPDNKDLKEYLHLLEEAKRRDHRIIGKELDLFSFHEEGPGFPFFHPNGMILYNAMMDYMRGELFTRGYGEVRTPIILNEALWHTSGHYENFRENMYFTEIDETKYAVKPMNCPGGLLIYRSQLRSYRDLPLRQAEFGLVHRHELSGVLHGLFRVRSFTQDDAHSFCTPGQLPGEIDAMVDFVLDVYRTFGFSEFELFIATRPAKFIGHPEDWDRATDTLKRTLEDKKMAYKIKAGEGAFYGPKIEFNIKDCLKRNWQCGTIQVDFSMPKRFELEYIAEDGKATTPVMVHRAILGSIERFLGIVIEHFAGDFPLWLSPRQAVVIPVSEKSLSYAKEVTTLCRAQGIRCETDTRAETLQKKIRDNEVARIPYMLVVGEKEAADGTVSVRRRKVAEQRKLRFDEMVAEMKTEIAERKLPRELK
ncbi:MAG: threonine--tRNA ligase [Elusimicrobia bacterium RIFOXYB2_FULL_49_7]|nr:MAG: threonine--tRNA ligase [Elusimicrobia bacterium RIFOXYB2_FULL_49_7]